MSNSFILLNEVMDPTLKRKQRKRKWLSQAISGRPRRTVSPLCTVYMVDILTERKIPPPRRSVETEVEEFEEYIPAPLAGRGDSYPSYAVSQGLSDSDSDSNSVHVSSPYIQLIFGDTTCVSLTVRCIFWSCARPCRN